MGALQLLPIIMVMLILCVGLPVTTIILVVRFIQKRRRGAALAATVDSPSPEAAGRCNICGQDNPPGARFCGNCGATLAVRVKPPSPEVTGRCSVCGQDNPPEARFCGNCGATLAAGVEPPPPEVVAGRLTGRRKWFLIGGLAILIIFGISYGVTSLLRPPPSRPTPVPAPRPVPSPSPTPTPPKVTALPITKGEVLFFEDFESGSQSWDLGEGWHLEKIGDNTVLKGSGHKWAELAQEGWDNYAFEARFKPVKGNIHFNYRRTTSAGHNRYFVGVNSGGIYLQKESGDKFYQIAQASLQLDEGWHEIEIIGYGNTIHVYVDDALLIVGKDDNPLLSGGIAFETLDDSEFLIDDVRITETGPPVIYVNNSYKGLGIGTKENPLTTIQEGIDSSDGIVRVAAGTYHENVDLKDNLVLLGAGADKTVIYGNVMANNITGAKICGFTITDDDTAGIHCYYSSLTIANNIIINQPDCGIGGHDNSLTIINNVIANNGGSGIGLGENCEVIIKNNIIVRSSGQGISVGESSSCSLEYNDVWHNSGSDYSSNIAPGPHDLSADPLFVDAPGDNFRLQPGSPCIDAGDPDSQYNDADGSRNDIGAFGGPAERTEPAATTPTSTAPETVTFADRNLEEAVRDALDKPPADEITAAELAELTELEAADRGISDLSGLEYCTSLTKLELGKNQISDISPLENLISLNVLELHENQISDISPLVENRGLGTGDEVELEDNNLDLSEGSADMENIKALDDRGVEVNYE